MVQAWFPNGAEDPNAALLAVKISNAQFWNIKESKIIQLYKMASAALTGQPPKNLGEHKEIALS